MAKDTEVEAAAPAAKTATPPSGQGGHSPKDTPDYQDTYPPNPEPSATAKAYAERVEKLGQVAAAQPD